MPCCCCQGSGVCCQGATCSSDKSACECQAIGGTFIEGRTCTSSVACVCPECPKYPKKITLTFSNFGPVLDGQSCTSNIGNTQSHPGDSYTQCYKKIIQKLTQSPIELPYTPSFEPLCSSQISQAGYFFFSGGGFFTDLGALPDGSPGCCQGSTPIGSQSIIEGNGLYASVLMGCNGSVSQLCIAALRDEDYPRATRPPFTVPYGHIFTSNKSGSWPSFCTENRQPLTFPMSVAYGFGYGVYGDVTLTAEG